MGNKYKVNVVVTNLDDPIDWWFHSCKRCWKKMIQAGVSRRCPTCRTPDEHYRYKLKLSATDVETNTENVPGHLAFLRECGEALIGKEADLLAPLTEGRPNYVPAAITATVGMKCTVIAQVDQETYDADPGIVFLTVSKAQLIADSMSALESPAHTSLAIADKAIAPANDLENTQSHLPEGLN